MIRDKLSYVKENFLTPEKFVFLDSNQFNENKKYLITKIKHHKQYGQ